ncbi:MAG: GTP-binding protein, partial [Kineosporiaceae bacterium]
MTPKKARRGARTGRPRPAAGGSPVPVTVLTGFLGSGKTTVLQSLLVQSWRSVPRVRVGVVVNDMSELDVDGVVVEETDVVGSGEGTLVTITGGPLHERIGALRAACESLLDRNDLDHLFIETSGSTRPRSLVTLLTRHPRLRLHGFLTMVDAAMLRDDLALGDAIAPRNAAQRAAGVPDLETLLVEQVRAASDIYLTKVDKLTDDQVRHV